MFVRYCPSTLFKIVSTESLSLILVLLLVPVCFFFFKKKIMILSPQFSGKGKRAAVAMQNEKSKE